MPLNRAQSIINYQNDRLGLLRTDLRLVDQLPLGFTQNTIDGVSFYYSAVVINFTTGHPVNTKTDLVVWITDGLLETGLPAADPLIPNRITFNNGYNTPTGYANFGVSFFFGKRVRFASFLDELLMVQDGGNLLMRFYSTQALGTALWRAGFSPPQASGSFPNFALSTSGTGLTGTWQYKITFADEHGRESSPSDAASITLVNQGTAVSWSTVYASPPTAYFGSNFVTVYLYRNTLGAPATFYRIAAHTIPAMTSSGTFVGGDFFFDAHAYDDAPDSAIVAGTLAPNPGENDAPNPASVICLWKNRILLDDVTNTSTLQISNTLSSTQFTSISLGIVTDGERTLVGTDQGDPITAIVDFGSYAAIFKRRACFFLSGNDITDFQIQPIYTRGCLSPDSAVRCDNQVLFLSDDGVYAASYGNGELVGKISKEIEAQLLNQPMTARETSYAWFVDNAYHLQVGQTTYVYQFDVLAWTTWRLGLRFNYGGGDAGIIGEVVPPVSTGGSQGGTVTPPATATITNPGC